eukprot:TRINITY_DN22802_c0_g1_i1.p2 TRINITY_DN22802_c0_g1~~TRINITY_DN22802_c0_g1_i1.p2  ORF type:complete len:242 (-),score=87.25 TRINITY_DN22802_c0_g1_i1:436-1161(-)
MDEVTTEKKKKLEAVIARNKAALKQLQQNAEEDGESEAVKAIQKEIAKAESMKEGLRPIKARIDATSRTLQQQGARLDELEKKMKDLQVDHALVTTDILETKGKLDVLQEQYNRTMMPPPKRVEKQTTAAELRMRVELLKYAKDEGDPELMKLLGAQCDMGDTGAVAKRLRTPTRTADGEDGQQQSQSSSSQAPKVNFAPRAEEAQEAADATAAAAAAAHQISSDDELPVFREEPMPTSLH